MARRRLWWIARAVGRMAADHRRSCEQLTACADAAVAVQRAPHQATGTKTHRLDEIIRRRLGG